MSEFKPYKLTQEIAGVRHGWCGVWDALVSAITKKPRAVFPHTMTVSVIASAPVTLTALQAETQPLTDSP